jgi:predicted PurR-regulated permease PerM
MVKKSTSDIIKQIVFLVLIIGLGIFLFTQLIAFLTAFLVAVIFYLLFRQMMQNLVEKYHWRKGLAASLIMFITFIIVLMPVFCISYMLFNKITDVLNDPSSLLLFFHKADDTLKNYTGYSLQSADMINKLKSIGTHMLPQFLDSVLNTLLTVAALYFILFYMLINYGSLEQTLEDYLPLDKVNTTRLASELKYMTYANAVGVPLIAIVQTGTLILGFWLFGLSDPVFWGVVAGVCSFLPVFGTTLVWVPAGIFMMASGHLWQGIFIILWGALIIGVLEQILRSRISNRIAKVHPIITIFGAILGLELFGLPGLIFGPLLMSYFLILIKIYRDEFASES